MESKKKDIEYQAEWHDKWMKFLAPLVGAAVTALGVYATAAQQSYSHRNDAKVEVIESQIRELETLKAENIAGSSDNKLHIKVKFNGTEYSIVQSNYDLVLVGTDFGRS